MSGVGVTTQHGATGRALDNSVTTTTRTPFVGDRDDCSVMARARNRRPMLGTNDNQHVLGQVRQQFLVRCRRVALRGWTESPLPHTTIVSVGFNPPKRDVTSLVTARCSFWYAWNFQRRGILTFIHACMLTEVSIRAWTCNTYTSA